MMVGLAVEYQLNFSNYFRNLNEGLCLFSHCQLDINYKGRRDDDAGYLL